MKRNKLNYVALVLWFVALITMFVGLVESRLALDYALYHSMIENNVGMAMAALLSFFFLMIFILGAIGLALILPRVYPK